jgi:aspartate ammonia-lyase
MKNNKLNRIEHDSLGYKKLSEEVYYGIQTKRAIENFPVSKIRESPELIKGYTIVKKAAAYTNMKLGLLEEKNGKAIIQAADEILLGNFDDQFPVDVFQAGAGTSFNMNINEVLANRALEILDRKKGDYEFLSPNDHVNMGQSSNDTFPTASHIAIIYSLEKFLPLLKALEESFIEKGKEFCRIPKTGRTHLMDAMPVTLGDEFLAYAKAINKSNKRINQRKNDLLEIPIGGTATGTGVNSHPKFKQNIIKKISEYTSFNFIASENSFEGLQSRSQMVALSSSLKELAIELIRIANDLRILNSGPTTGLAEIELPAVQPGSSIMPGKVNPVMVECLNMICFQIIGNDTTVSYAGQAGQMELNVMTPVMTYNIITSISLLTNYLPVFTRKCIKGIIANEEKCRSYLEKNPSLATLLSPKIGYLKAAEIAKESLEKNISIEKLAITKGIISKEEAEILFHKKNMLKCKK